KYAPQILDQIATQQLPRRYVDARENRFARAGGGLPLSELPSGMVEHEEAEVDDEPNFLGDRDKLGRRQASEFRMIPARERLESGNAAIPEPPDRLVQHLDFLALDGAAQLGFHGQTVGLA